MEPMRDVEHGMKLAGLMDGLSAVETFIVLTAENPCENRL